jgi:hypothetical protein
MAGPGLIVMAGLGPAIHVFVATARKNVDGLAIAAMTDATVEVVSESAERGCAPSPVQCGL